MCSILPLPVVLIAFGLLTSAHAQNFPVTPANPSAFAKRDLGGGLGSSVAGVQRVKGKTITISYIAVTDPRAWKNTEGKSIVATLLAFEEGEADTVARPLTLIQNGKVKLLVSGKDKASLLPMNKLSDADQSFIKALDAFNKKAAAKKSENRKP